MSEKTMTAQVETSHGYPELETLVRQRVASTIHAFTTRAEDLFGLFLSALPDEYRQHYNCNCCRRFFERYGNLVSIDESGEQHPLLWNLANVPDFFKGAFTHLWRVVRSAKVTGVFLWKETTWGTPVTGPWTHLSGVAPKCQLPTTKTADQVMAEKLEDYKILRHALADYHIGVAAAAVRILEADALDRSEKTLGVAKFFHELHQDIQKTQRNKDNVVWRAVAKAPPGFCHVRSTMISTLLDDLKAGVDLSVITTRWAKKMHPLTYQRAQAELKEGQVKAANKVVEKLMSAGSLSRRFAKLSDITYSIWQTMPDVPEVKESATGAFDHLLKKSKVPEIELPTKTMTWVKFQAEVLPAALDIKMYVPYGRQAFGALVTAANPEAPPLLQWNNSVSWYLYQSGSEARNWTLAPGSWVDVPLVTCLPCHWERTENPCAQAHQNEGVIMVLAGAQDTRHTAGGGWFPECLRSEYHEIRAAMEHFAKNAAIAGVGEGDANGLFLQKGSNWACELRVRDKSGYARYKLDRWD